MLEMEGGPEGTLTTCAPPRAAHEWLEALISDLLTHGVVPITCNFFVASYRLLRSAAILTCATEIRAAWHGHPLEISSRVVFPPIHKHDIGVKQKSPNLQSDSLGARMESVAGQHSNLLVVSMTKR